jgi:hypothetical protein
MAMDPSRRKVFVSYVHDDDNKRRAFVRVLEGATPPIEAVVVATRRLPGKPLTEKVSDGITESDYFVPILTRASVGTQWVNQEIGYATALGRPTLALVEAEIMPDLKGFIHDQQDLPFSFPGLQNRRREASAFRKACLRLREHLETTSLAKTLQSNISPKRVRTGEEYTTEVRFRGTVRFGFFDNLVVNRASGHQLWQWDPETLPGIPGQPIDLTAGTLNGAVDVTRRYNHSTAGWSPGSYSVYVRLYSHLEPGVLGRQLIAENEHALEVHGA